MNVQSTKYSVLRTNSNGQALVLVLLSLAVVLTVVLFVIGRSVTDINLSSSESQAVSAFSAAEAGVEQALVIGSGGSANIGDAHYDAAVTGVGNATSFVYPSELVAADNMTLWLKSQDTSPSFTQTANSTIKFCWGKPLTNAANQYTPAVEISIYYTESGVAKVYRATADSNGSRVSSNSFGPATNSTCTIDGKNFQFNKTLSGLPANMQFATVRMFYNTTTSHPIGFDSLGTGTFPNQGILVSSSGTSGEAGPQVTRKVQVFQGWPEIPSAFLYGIFSPVGLVK